MEKILLHQSILDQLTGRSYYAGELQVDEEIPAYLAGKAVGAGLAEVVEGDSPLPASDVHDADSAEAAEASPAAPGPSEPGAPPAA